MQACRDSLKDLVQTAGSVSHAGLVLSRYLAIAAWTKEKTGGKGSHTEARKQLFEAAIGATLKAKSLYEHAFSRWQSSLASETTCQELQARGRLIVGLGADNILETGITLHHTYGVPFVPGSCLKGLAAHYCAQVWGEAESGFSKTGSHFRKLFGTSDDAGHLVFHDAWITPDSLSSGSGLVLDVMTPHHGDYYGKKERQRPDRTREAIPPTDFDDPNPVSFLSVTGRFLVAVSCDVPGDHGRNWAALGMSLLAEALREWGVGGKTSSGYGRLVPGVDSQRSQKSQPPERTTPVVEPNKPVQASRTVRTEPTKRVVIPPPRPLPPVSQVRREVVILVMASGAKGRVRTQMEEDIPVSGLPFVPRLEAGTRCRADVERQNGKAVRAIFKGTI